MSPFLFLFIAATAVVVDLAVRQASAALVKRALDGDERARRELTRRLLPFVQARVKAWFGMRGGRMVDARDADDMVQEIWLVLVQDKARLLRAFDPVRGKSLEGYVGMVCRRELWRRSTAAQRQKRGSGKAGVNLELVPEISVAETPIDERVAQRDLLGTIRQRVETELSERGRLIFALLYEDGLSTKETADRLDVAVQVVYNWQHRIRKLARSVAC